MKMWILQCIRPIKEMKDSNRTPKMDDADSTEKNIIRTDIVESTCIKLRVDILLPQAISSKTNTVYIFILRMIVGILLNHCGSILRQKEMNRNVMFQKI